MECRSGIILLKYLHVYQITVKIRKAKSNVKTSLVKRKDFFQKQIPMNIVTLLIYFCCCDLAMTNSNLRERGLFHLLLPGNSQSVKNSPREAEAEYHGSYCLSVCFLTQLGLSQSQCLPA